VREGNFSAALIRAEQIGIGLGSEWSRAYVGAGKEAASFLEDTVSVVASFDQTNEAAVKAMQENNLRLVREVTEQQRAAINKVLVDGVRDGINPREIALGIRDSIGLTEYQLQVVENYRDLLERGSQQALDRELRDRRFDSTVQDSVDRGGILSDDQIDTMVDRYSERMLNYRAEVIGRTEALRAVHEGTEDMFQQAVDDGTIDEDTMTREWDTSKDSRVRDSHEAMDGQVVGLFEPFTSGLGNQLQYPGDPDGPPEDTVQCRCAVLYRMDAEAPLNTPQPEESFAG
jgi:hypothetical protein